MAFTGWPAEALDFYRGLEADNSRAYWQAHKAVYDEAVRRPMEELLAELADEHGEGKVFRPNRDVRFSDDKSPYKTAIGATLAGGGYVQLSATGLGLGRGYYVMDRDQLDRYRRAVDDETTGARLVEVVGALAREEIDVMSFDTLKTAPRGYARDHPRVELLRHKGLVAWQEHPAAPWLSTRAARDRVVTFLEGSRPLSDWLDREVGPGGD